jgi:protein O-mannosyl-transferase
MSAAFNWRFFFLSAAVLLSVSLIGYHNVLFNFFCGDDFVHLIWLHRAQSHPELLWQNFHSNWLEVPTTKFYRPIISVFMFIDYALWKANGLGFHITNLAFHFLSSLFLCLTLVEIANIADLKSVKNFEIKTWALGAAALFALYPLHPEAVSWITGRVDSIVTAFCLISIWCYLRWQNTKHILFLFFSLIFFCLGLGSKEMAVIIPPLVIFIELQFRKRTFAFALFCLVLIAYFVLRKFALGTFIGGYDNSLLVEGNPFSFVSPFIRSIVELIAPINKELFDQPRHIVGCWMFVMLSLLLSTLYTFPNPRIRSVAYFLIGWFVLSLAPIYKLFNISPDLQGSRLAYLASAPFCALILLGISHQWKAKKTRSLRYVFIGVTLLFAAYLLIGNNRSWQISGEQTSAMLKSFDALSREQNVDAPTYITGLPDAYAGAYMCRNAIEGMTQYPQISRDIPHCFRLDNFDQVFPFGFAKDTIQSDPHSRIFRWESNDKKLVPITLTGNRYFEMAWPNTKPVKLSLGKLGDAFEFEFPNYTHRWQTELITFTLTTSNTLDPQPVTLFYGAEYFPNRHRLPVLLENNGRVTKLSFCLRGEVDWALGKGSADLKLGLPQNITFTIENVEVRHPGCLVPLARIQPAQNQNINGYLELNPKFNQAEITPDISRFENAKSLELEVSKPNQFFLIRNDPQRSQDVGQVRKTNPSEAKITLRLEDFPQDGIYDVRLRALDIVGKPIGFAGDNIVLTVHH